MKEVFAHLPEGRAYFSDSGHLKEPGHLLLAKAIVGKIREAHRQLGVTVFKMEAKEGGG
jgi:hypothetical protein